MAEIAIHLRIAGRVQGVGYRAWSEREAARRGLRGWARNRLDGTVEALLIGEREAVEAMIEACRRGPRMAEVDAIERAEAEDDDAAGFRTLPTV